MERMFTKSCAMLIKRTRATGAFTTFLRICIHEQQPTTHKTQQQQQQQQQQQ
jgi:hypothetical protein